MLNYIFILKYLYLVTYIVTIVPSLLLKQYADNFSKNNVLSCINDILIERYAYLWFTIVYLSFLLAYCNDNWKINHDHVRRFSLTYFINTVFYIIFIRWCMGPLIFSRINMATGGICEGTLSLTPHQCITNNGTWINGFDVSGHFYVIISSSLLIGRECFTYISSHDNRVESQSISQLGVINKIHKYYRFYGLVLVSVSICLVSAWFIMYLITCLFFHTPTEKFVGLLFGYIVPLITERF